MITRGYLIGFIIDELADIVAKASLRTKLNLNDISIFSEDFFTKVLNLIYSFELKNLNTNKANYPGIDIGDKKKKIAYQVSLNVDMTKIKETIEKIEKTKNIKEDFEQFRFFVIGNKQKTYTIPNNELNITKKSIYDINDINREILSLEIDTLMSLKEYIEKESTKVKMEFEIPDKDGNYYTSLSNYLEKIPRENIENCRNLLYSDLTDDEYNEIETDLIKFINKLKRLPRVTREFISIVVDKSQEKKGYFKYRLAKLEKVLNYDFESDLSISCDEGFFNMDQDFDSNDNSYYDILVKNEFLIAIKSFAEDNTISSRKLIVSLDFSE